MGELEKSIEAYRKGLAHAGNTLEEISASARKALDSVEKSYIEAAKKIMDDLPFTKNRG